MGLPRTASTATLIRPQPSQGLIDAAAVVVAGRVLEIKVETVSTTIARWTAAG